jgi:Cys-tRNA(Pro)/Cys-tRNA(Cys) deacylase
MAKGTPATVVLETANEPFTLHEYDYDPAADRIGMQAAEALGIAPARLLKTLMVEVGGKPAVAIIASDKTVNLKKLAAAAKVKEAAMMAPTKAERLTGYHVGGISPLGQKKKVPAFLDAAAMAFATVLFNGGRRGLQIELPPARLAAFTGAVVVELG